MTHVINLAAQTILSHIKAEAITSEVYMAEQNTWQHELSPCAVLKKISRIISKL